MVNTPRIDIVYPPILWWTCCNFFVFTTSWFGFDDREKHWLVIQNLYLCVVWNYTVKDLIDWDKSCPFNVMYLYIHVYLDFPLQKVPTFCCYSNKLTFLTITKHVNVCSLKILVQVSSNNFYTFSNIQEYRLQRWKRDMNIINYCRRTAPWN